MLIFCKFNNIVTYLNCINDCILTIEIEYVTFPLLNTVILIKYSKGLVFE